MTISRRTDKMGDTTIGIRSSPKFPGGGVTKVEPVGTPIDSEKSGGGKGGGDKSVPTSDFGAPKPGRKSGDSDD